jgi:tyrosyl-tRNA synthetase
LAACPQVDSEGRKFGKSTGGAIWLSAEKLSPYKFYQYLFQVRSSHDVVQNLLRPWLNRKSRGDVALTA